MNTDIKDKGIKFKYRSKNEQQDTFSCSRIALGMSQNTVNLNAAGGFVIQGYQ
jgi:hypothetical protein